MGPNGIVGDTSRGNVGILVTPEEMGAITGNSMTKLMSKPPIILLI